MSVYRVHIQTWGYLFYHLHVGWKEREEKKSQVYISLIQNWLFLIAHGSHPVSSREYLQGPSESRPCPGQEHQISSHIRESAGVPPPFQIQVLCQNASLSSPILTTPMCPPLTPFNLLSGRIPCLALFPQPFAVIALVPRNFNLLHSHLARLGAVNSL